MKERVLIVNKKIYGNNRIAIVLEPFFYRHKSNMIIQYYYKCLVGSEITFIYFEGGRWFMSEFSRKSFIKE